MDKDIEIRRILFVVIFGDGYFDFINGFQDYGWCSGYICRKRFLIF